jgi:hypothetical protein
MIGERRRFDYPEHFVTMPEYTARRGAIVTVVRQLTQEEADQGEGMERMYKVRCDDGWEGDAWESELVPSTED